jgi:predicted nucleic acid-binding Zn ribbon protein
MPVYEYECSKCGHRFDRLHKHTDPAPPCPKIPDNSNPGFEKPDDPRACGGASERKISGGTFHLKGGGWANDGYS